MINTVNNAVMKEPVSFMATGKGEGYFYIAIDMKVHF
jgi:hypothetical protein